MKNMIGYLLILTLALDTSGQNIKALDSKFGFREMHFNDSITVFNDLVPIEYSNDSLSVFYTRTGDKLTIGNAEVTISYGFYKDKFYSVFIKTKGFENSRELLTILKELYGRGYQDNNYIERYSWHGKKVSLSYEQNSITGDSDVLMYSRESISTQKRDNAERAKRSKNDF